MRLSGKLNEALRRVYQRVLEELRPEMTLPVKAAVADARGEELAGGAEIGEHVPGPVRVAAEGAPAGCGGGAATAIDRALPGRARGRWRSYPTWYLDHAMPPDGPRSRFAEAEGAIYLNAQHPDYLAAKAARSAATRARCSSSRWACSGRSTSSRRTRTRPPPARPTSSPDSSAVRRSICRLASESAKTIRERLKASRSTSVRDAARRNDRQAAAR